MSLTSSRDNWERLVAAVVKRQQIWELCHQPSRSPSISTIATSDDDLSEPTLSNLELLSVHPSPRFPPEVLSFSQVSNNASSGPFVRILFSAWNRIRKSKDKDLVDIPADYPEVNLGQLERFSFHRLQVATDSFSDRNLLGIGGFGRVYFGRLIDGTLVAVKRLKKQRTTDRSFQTEVKMFCFMAAHSNLHRLRGICVNLRERFLVYPYIVNGSLASCLRERPPTVPPLDWLTRKRIAMGCARGLAYLHELCDPKIIHGDVKAANILLNEEYEAIIGDFSLAQVMDHNDTHVSKVVRGTFGHIAPEYMSTGKMSEKSDVFAYGVTLLELISAQRAFDLARLANDYDDMLLDWVKWLLEEKKLKTLVDPDLPKNYWEEEVEQLVQVALLCTQRSALGRPKMSEVVLLLEGDGLAEKWDEWKKDEESEDVELDLYPDYDRINFDYVEDLDADELSGPR